MLRWPSIHGFAPVPRSLRAALAEAADALEALPLRERRQSCPGVAAQFFAGARCALQTAETADACFAKDLALARASKTSGISLSANVAVFVAPASQQDACTVLRIAREGLNPLDLQILVLFSLHVLPLLASSRLHLMTHLSPREAETLSLLAAACSEAEMCADLRISKHTLRTHIRHLYRRFGVQSRAELLAIRAVREAFDMPVERHGLAALSPRQRAIVELLSRGLSEKEVAGALRISAHTVHGHVKAAHRRLHVSRRAELVDAAVAG